MRRKNRSITVVSIIATVVMILLSLHKLFARIVPENMWAIYVKTIVAVEVPGLILMLVCIALSVRFIIVCVKHRYRNLAEVVVMLVSALVYFFIFVGGR